MFTATLLVLLSISLIAGLYAFAEASVHGRWKSIAWSTSVLVLAVILLSGYLRFVLQGLPLDW